MYNLFKAKIRKHLGYKPQFYRTGPSDWQCDYPKAGIAKSYDTHRFITFYEDSLYLGTSKQLYEFIKKYYELK